MNINKYKDNLNTFYKHGTTNHLEHNANPHYYEILLHDITNNNFNNKVFLDFGCGKGRNINNVDRLAKWDSLIGIDISTANIEYCKQNNISDRFKFYKNNGDDIKNVNTSSVDYVLSTIVLQHLCCRSLRISIKKEIYRILKEDGIFSFQMGFDNESHNNHDYFAECSEDTSNGSNDVSVTNEDQLTTDLLEIGFKNITHKIYESFSDNQHSHWIYTRCEK